MLLILNAGDGGVYIQVNLPSLIPMTSQMASGSLGNDWCLASELQERHWGLMAVDSTGLRSILSLTLPIGVHPGFW